jgi:methyl-accepting chemotaxis protein
MTTLATTIDDQNGNQNDDKLFRIGTFIKWLLPIGILMTVLQGITVALHPSLSISIMTITTLVVVLLLLLARFYVGRGKLYHAAAIVCSSLLIMGIIIVLVSPDLLAAAVFFPIIALTVGLHVFDSRMLAFLSIIGLVFSVAIVLLGQFVELFAPPPMVAVHTIQIAGNAAGFGIILLLIWLFHSHTNTIVGNIQTANQNLEEARARLEAHVEELQAANEVKVAREYLEEVVERYSTFAAQVMEGNLTVRLTISEDHDSLTRLGHSLNSMVESLRQMVEQTQQAAAAIASATTEILASTAQQASSTTENSSSVTEIAATIEQVKTIAQQVSQKANHVASESQEALQVARQGSKAVDDSIGGMENIRQRVEGIAHTILSLSEQTQMIGTITTTVSDLADQSNLLALNAAIEAARAGEQGKSFAVVAQQVRDLAERSKAATAQVQEILMEIQRATNAAVMATEEGTKGVEQGTKLSESAGQVIRRIATEIENTSQANVQMAAASNQATTGIVQVGQAIAAIHQATNEMVASVRQTEQASKDLQALSHSLQKAIAAYKTT